ncbi:hypothetical protein ACUIJN_17255 [Metabacillus halosaccharovorans]|uniref:hypothetical protein n=1 Tax=Metabacillus halosaccharovorans TaxID=930124 RepID=UPI002041C84E|nr:hypothetical protein [Metabacillus halosaccharovorans]MCM3441404.1 hypothetical protein [Metabacillus halosaccharovorans]
MFRDSLLNQNDFLEISHNPTTYYLEKITFPLDELKYIELLSLTKKVTIVDNAILKTEEEICLTDSREVNFGTYSILFHQLKEKGTLREVYELTLEQFTTIQHNYKDNLFEIDKDLLS